MTTTILSPNRHLGRIRPIRLVVIHTMEVAESDSGVAEAVARAFADPRRGASAHICVDTNSDVRTVADKDTAWAAPGANADGLQLEMAGRAGQTPAQWADPDSRAILARAAHVVAAWCRAYDIPPRWLTDAQLADGKTKGIVGHDAVSRVFRKSDHWDPGKNFPKLAFLTQVRNLLTPPTTAKDWFAMATPADLEAAIRKVLADPAVLRNIARFVTEGYPTGNPSLVLGGHLTVIEDTLARIEHPKGA